MTRINRRKVLKMLGGTVASTLGGSSLLTGCTSPGLVKSNQITSISSQYKAEKSVTERIADYLVNEKFDDIPEAVVQKAKEQLAFFFGRAFEGAFDQKADHVRAMARQINQVQGGASVIAERFRLLPADAAFANCSLMRGSTRDDVIWPAGIHAGVITLPTALAIGETKRVSGRELLSSIILGYEVLGKLGSVANGWSAPMPRRPTIIYGGFGPVTVAGRLLGLDRNRMTHALGYASNIGMGVPERGMVRHYYSLVNRNGVFSAQLAEAGGTPYSKFTIEGDLGLYRSFFGEVPAGLNQSIDNLGSDWEILKAEQKRYPGTGQSAVAIKLLVNLVKEQKLTAEQVVKVDVFMTPERRFREKEFMNKGPFIHSHSEIYSSLPFALAHTLIDGEPKMERYGYGNDMSKYNDPNVLRQMQKINGFYEEGHASKRYYRIEVETADGRRLVRAADTPHLSLPRDKWGGWLQQYGKRLLAVEQLEKLEQLIGKLENLDDVSKLMATVVPAAGATKQSAQGKKR